MEDGILAEIENPRKSATVLCVQYLISKHMKSKGVIKKDDLMKTVFKGRITGKNYDRVMEDVINTLKYTFGFDLYFIKEDRKQFIIVNKTKEIDIPGITYGYSEQSKHRVLLKPIIGALVMLQKPISEGQMWNIMEHFSVEFNIDMNQIKAIVKGDFVKELYLEYKATDDTTIMLDPEKTSYWFSLGPRALAGCDQMVLLQQVAKLFNVPATSYKRVYAAVSN